MVTENIVRAGGESPFAALLKKELLVAMGCTEPAAAALAASSARSALGIRPESVLIRASRDIIKNAMHAGIPHTSLKGIKAAAALGLAIGDPSMGLNIFSRIGNEAERQAREYLDSGILGLELAEGAPPVFVEVRLEAGSKRKTARILHEHSHVEISDDPAAAKSFGADIPAVPGPELELPAIYEYATRAPAEDLAFLIGGARTNLELAKHSVARGYGIQIGKTMLKSAGISHTVGAAPEDILFRQAAALAAAASEARMAGCSMPVVINSGSGNQGIAVSVPVLVLAEGLGRGPEEASRALCLAHLAALMITARKDRLSALCGAFTASIGTAAGFVMLLGGDCADTERCINNMAANLIGLLCDGAKGSCALKVHSCVEAAALGAKLALEGRSTPAAEGILGNTLDETLLAIEKISHEGMIPLDKTVLSLMMKG